MTDEEKLKQAMNIVLRGNDIKSAKTILEAVALDNYKLVGGRVNHFKIAVRQILNYIEETQYKGILDVTREKVALKEELKKKNNRIKDLESDNYECNNRINDYIETINKIQEEFLKYDWKNSNNEQIYNQLKSLYNEIFKETEENRK